MITTEGSIHIKRYMAGLVPSIALSMAFGVGQKAEVASDRSLQFEVGRSDIQLVGYDFAADKLVYKATLDEGFDATLYEAALFSLETNTGAGEYGSRLLASFDSLTETWWQASVPATYTTDNTRIGVDSVKTTVSASGTVVVNQPSVFMDLSGYSAADEFNFAFYCNNTNLSSIAFRFYTDASNYYTVTVPSASITSGFNVVRITKGAAAVTGVPNWGIVTSLEARVSAKSLGSVEVNLEGIRIEDNDTPSPEYVMVARSLLALPFDKVAGRIQEIEFPLGVTVNGA